MVMEELIEVSLLYFERCFKIEEFEVVMIFVNVEKGGVLVLVVGCDVCYFGFNCVLDIKCNIGLLVKLVVYLMVFESGQFNVVILVDDLLL